MGQTPERGISLGCQHVRSGAPKSKGPLRDQEEAKGELTVDSDPRVVPNLHRVRSKDHGLIPTTSAPKAHDFLERTTNDGVLSIGMSISAGN